MHGYPIVKMMKYAVVVYSSPPLQTSDKLTVKVEDLIIMEILLHNNHTCGHVSSLRGEGGVSRIVCPVIGSSCFDNDRSGRMFVYLSATPGSYAVILNKCQMCMYE